MKKLFTILASFLAVLAITTSTARAQSCKVFADTSFYICPGDLITPLDLENQVIGINFEEGAGTWYALNPSDTLLPTDDTCSSSFLNGLSTVADGIFMVSNANEDNSYTFIYKSNMDQGCGIKTGGVAIAKVIVLSRGDLLDEVCEDVLSYNLLDLLNSTHGLNTVINGTPFVSGEVQFVAQHIVYEEGNSVFQDNPNDIRLSGDIYNVDGLATALGGQTAVNFRYVIKRRPPNGDSLVCVNGTIELTVNKDSITIANAKHRLCPLDTIGNLNMVQLLGSGASMNNPTWGLVYPSSLDASLIPTSADVIIDGDSLKAALAPTTIGDSVVYSYTYQYDCDDASKLKTAHLTIVFRQPYVDTTGFKNDYCLTSLPYTIDFEQWYVDKGGLSFPNGGSWEYVEGTVPVVFVNTANRLVNADYLTAGTHTFIYRKNSTHQSKCVFPDSLVFTINVEDLGLGNQSDVVREFCATTTVADYNLDSMLMDTIVAGGTWVYVVGPDVVNDTVHITNSDNFDLTAIADSLKPVVRLQYLVDGDVNSACSGGASVNVYLSFVNDVIINNRTKYFCYLMDGAKNINIGTILGSELKDGTWTVTSGVTNMSNVISVGDGKNLIFKGQAEYGTSSINKEYVFTYTGLDCNKKQQSATVTIKIGLDLP
ncbi:MAG: hypothetical protein ACK5IQ_07285 [Bacteroidales bacterium]